MYTEINQVRQGHCRSGELVIHVGASTLGNEFQAVVEFAPYQKVPSDRKKVDARLGTIEKGNPASHCMMAAAWSDTRD